jgi:phage host-nuclease inhibitor protein Gam
MFMTNQYITVENQTLLWKTIQRSPQFSNNTIAINREQWFSSIIKQFYENIKSPKMSIAELKALNQQTISYMIGDLKRIESLHKVPPSTIPTTPQSPPYQNTSITQLNYETPQTRMSIYTDQFNARQQEYATMGKPLAPPIANFSEKVEDDAITNMDELLQQQIKQREYDVAMVRPPPPALSVDANVAEEAQSLSKSNNTVSTDVMTAIRELAKQLTELKEEIRVLKETTHIKPVLKKNDEIELPGVEV